MKKFLVFGLVIAAVSAAIALAQKRRSPETTAEREERREMKRRAMVEKIQEGMESLPEDFPPVVMFDNVSAIKENSERILELLEEGRSGADEKLLAAAT